VPLAHSVACMVADAWPVCLDVLGKLFVTVLYDVPTQTVPSLT
jgi:hypothetical protein